MGIGGINDYSSLFQNYRVPTIPTVSVDEVRRQERVAEDTAASTVVNTQSHDIPSVEIPERKDASLEDISITFNKGDDFGYLGKDSDIHSLDVEKALDDMRKDRVLQQYQYFVGSSKNIQSESMDGIVVQKF